MRARHVSIVVVFGLLLSACGGAGSPAPAPVGHPSNPAKSRLTPETKSGRSNEGAGSAAAQAETQTVVQQAASPCAFVSKSQASAIVGEAIEKPRVAPQGPTCIYTTKGGKRFFSLAVQSMQFEQFRKQLGKPQKLTVSGRNGLCATNGQPTLYVPIGGGRVLSVAGPCAIAKRFAAAALAHLKA
ncbi:DUF3558 domain-containing protein [Solirubrobacter ginsenosidimutans]|uniref:DUF3558 domain-containing protein n=1 Tax=Solirubrobacter ginsenosidimutans TaxID=490573 RepID=A0A9X3N443_9ACTN|nr:hypothetical protein [Solirubrobacter ginsenosidimutans]MDA0166931.1 DUF3558 domain-containing protein [Solirubrobacter ginsenosidimutans]